MDLYRREFENNFLNKCKSTALTKQAFFLMPKEIMPVFFVMYLPELIRLLGQLAISRVMRLPLKYVYGVLPLSLALMSYHIVNFRQLQIRWNAVAITGTVGSLSQYFRMRGT